MQGVPSLVQIDEARPRLVVRAIDSRHHQGGIGQKRLNARFGKEIDVTYETHRFVAGQPRRERVRFYRKPSPPTYSSSQSSPSKGQNSSLSCRKRCASPVSTHTVPAMA